MAKPRGKTKGGARKRRPAKGPDLPLQIAKILGSLALLIVLVLAGGLVADFYLKRPGEKSSAAIRPDVPYSVPSKAPSAEKTHKIRKPDAPAPAASPAQRPVYEVPTQVTPPSRPLAPLPQLPGQRQPMVAIVIDDIGYDRRIAERFMDLAVPVTFSMLPHGTFSSAILKQARSKGLEIMLHLPMEPHEYPAVDPGPGALLADMPPDDLIARLNEDIDQFPGLKGVNNHMGSRLSTSSEQMRQIFTILKKRGLYYIDSRTTAETVAEPSARLLQLPFAERDIFIDHFEDEAFIRSQLQRLIQRARQQGYAIGIGHPHAVTYRVLREFLPTLQAEVALVPASMVVNEVMVAQAAKTQTAGR